MSCTAAPTLHSEVKDDNLMEIKHILVYCSLWCYSQLIGTLPYSKVFGIYEPFWQNVSCEGTDDSLNHRAK